jgi:5-methylcytosine-specific restriction endonuclease McrA
MGVRWSEAELSLLSDVSLSLGEVAARTGRTAASAEHKASRLGIDRVFRQGGKGRARSWQRGWEPWELELLAEPDIPLAGVADLTGRTYGAVKHKASRLGLVDIRDYWLRGEANPHYRGGRSPSERTYRGQTWPEVRRGVLERDGFTCQDGGEFVPSSTGLVVHHVIPYRLRPVNDPRWLVTLCVSHHLRRPEHWWRTIPTDIEEALAAGGG